MKMKDLFGERLFELPQPKSERAFDGRTYDPLRDHARMQGQLGRVFRLMADGKWRTLAQITAEIGGSEAGVSARLRDLRKEKYGSLEVQRRHLNHGLWDYRLVIPEPPP